MLKNNGEDLKIADKINRKKKGLEYTFQYLVSWSTLLFKFDEHFYQKREIILSWTTESLKATSTN